MPRIPHPLAVYIHWPYCARICSYCDFVKYKAPSWLMRTETSSMLDPTMVKASRHKPVTRDNRSFDTILASYQTDVFRHASFLSQPSQPSWRVDTIFFGGGTPSLAPPAFVERLLAFVHQRFNVSPDVEVTALCAPALVNLSFLSRLADHVGGQSILPPT